MDSDAVSGVFDTPLTLKHSSDDVSFNNTDADDVSFNNDDNKYNRIIPCLKTHYAKDTPLKDSSLQKTTRVIKLNHQVPALTSKFDGHDTQGWEQVERPKRQKSDKPSNSQIMTKLAETQITEQAKESSFKKILKEIKNDKLMEKENTDVCTDDDVGMDTADIEEEKAEDGVDSVATAVDEIEELPDIILRATHSYKNDFPHKNANEYEVTK